MFEGTKNVQAQCVARVNDIAALRRRLPQWMRRCPSYSSRSQPAPRRRRGGRWLQQPLQLCASWCVPFGLLHPLWPSTGDWARPGALQQAPHLTPRAGVMIFVEAVTVTPLTASSRASRSTVSAGATAFTEPFRFTWVPIGFRGGRLRPGVPPLVVMHERPPWTALGSHCGGPPGIRWESRAG